LATQNLDDSSGGGVDFLARLEDAEGRLFKGASMHRALAHNSLSLLFAAGAMLGGCDVPLSGPTKEIRSPEPQVVFTSLPTPGEVAQASYVEPARVNDSPGLKPFAQWTEKDTAADALGRIGPAAVPALRQALQSEDADVRLKAVQVLARMGSDAKDAVPDLVVLLDDPDERIRKATTRTLGRIGPEAAPAVPALMRSLLQAEPSPPVELQPVPVE
jgi:HEAT repeats